MSTTSLPRPTGPECWQILRLIWGSPELAPWTRVEHPIGGGPFAWCSQRQETPAGVLTLTIFPDGRACFYLRGLHWFWCDVHLGTILVPWLWHRLRLASGVVRLVRELEARHTIPPARLLLDHLTSSPDNSEGALSLVPERP